MSCFNQNVVDFCTISNPQQPCDRRATHEPFDVYNPRHMAVAREIEAAFVPFNALPWPPEDHVD